MVQEKSVFLVFAGAVTNVDVTDILILRDLGKVGGLDVETNRDRDRERP